MSKHIVSVGDGEALVNVTTETPQIENLPFVNDDYCVTVMATRNNSDTITETTAESWVSISNHNTGLNGSSRVFAKITDGTENNPTFTVSGAATDLLWTTSVFRGLQATTEAGTVIATATSNGNDDQVTFPTVDTTGFDNAVILYIITTELRERKWFISNNIKQELNVDNDSSGTSAGVSIGWYVQQTGGTTASNVVAMSGGNVVDYTLHVIALKNDGNDDIGGQCDPAIHPATLVHPLFNNFNNHFAGDLQDSGERFNDPSTIITNLEDPSTGVATIRQATNGIANVGFTETNYGSPNYSGFNINSTGFWNDVNINGTKLVGTHDFTNSVFSIMLFSSGVGTYTWANDGAFWVGFLNGNLTDGAAATFRLAASDTVVRPTNGIFPYIFDTSSSGNYQTHTGGTGLLDLSVVNRLAVAMIPLANLQAAFGWLNKLEYFTLISGSTTTPATLGDASDHTVKVGLRTIQNQSGQSTSQFYTTQSVQLGNGGTNVCIIKLTGQACGFPSAFDSDTKFVHGNVEPGAFEFLLKAGASDNFDLSGFTLDCGDNHKFSIDPAYSTSATATFSGMQVISGDITLNDVGFAIAGLTFTNPLEITKNDCDLSGGSCVITGCTETRAISVSTQAELDEIAAVSFTDNSNIAITITGDQTALTIGEDMFFSGNVTDVEYTGATNLTLTVPVSSNSLTTTLQSGAGTITLDTPAISYTVTSTEAGSLIQIFDNLTQTVLASTTGTSLSHEYTGTPTFSSVVQKAGFLPQRRTSILMDGSNFTSAYTLVADPVYDSGHGLTYTTDFSWASNQLTVPTFGPTVRQVWSGLIDAFIAETSLRNTAFNIQMNGPNSMFLIEDAEGATDGDIENMTDGGVRYIDTVPAATAEWFGVQSISGTTPTGTGEYQLTDGSATTDARASGDFDELIKMFGDASHGNFDTRTHAVLKFQINGYRESRVDVLNTYGISTLEPTLYVVAMDPQAIDMTIGDPAISITIVDHTGAPLSVGGKDFDFEIQDNATNSGIDIERELNYNLSLDAVYEGRDPFNWPPMVGQLGGSFETLQGIVEGISGNHGIYVSRSAADHPDFVQFQSNDGTYYVPITLANVSAPNLTAGRVQVCNVTGATASAWAATTAYSLGDYVLRTTGKGTELGDGVFFVCTTAGTSGGSEPTFDVAADGNTTADGTVVWTTRPAEFDNDTVVAGYSNSWIDGEHFAAGDVIRLRWADSDDLEIETTGIATSDGTTTFLDTPVDDEVYDTYGLDGSTITKFAADYVDIEVDLIVGTNFAASEFYAWWKFNLISEEGIRIFFGGITAVDAANIRTNNDDVNIFWDNDTSSNVYQTDNIRLFRTDEAYPVKDPTTGGGGIDVVWRDKVFVVSTGGSALEPSEKIELTAAAASLKAADTLETGVQVDEALRLILAEAAGKVSVSGSTVAFRDQADTKDRIAATTDANGQRTSITTDTS